MWPYWLAQFPLKDAGLYGYSMAIGVVIFVFSFALSALVNRATEREPLEF